MLATFAIIASIKAWVVAHQTLLLGIVAFMTGLDHWLASTDKLKSSSTGQLISNICKGVLKVLGIVYRLSTGKTMEVPVYASPAPIAPATPTAAEVMQKAIESPASVLEAGQSAAFQKAFEHGEVAISDALKQ